jgi:hypothetical protein
MTRSVVNRITDVQEGSIGRFSAQGTSNESSVSGAIAESLWSELRGADGGSPFLYFTKALALAALPGSVEDMDGELVLRYYPAELGSLAPHVQNFTLTVFLPSSPRRHNREIINESSA